MNTTKCSFAFLSAGVMMVAANVAAAFPIVGAGLLAPPPVTAEDSGRSGYQGSGAQVDGNGNWTNALPAGQQGLMVGSSYNPATCLLTLNNFRVESNTKHLWVRVVTDQQNGYNPPGGGAVPGQPADQGRPAGTTAWGVCTAPNAVPTMTGASWQRENFNGLSLLVLYMTWDITPQPGSETVNLTSVAAGLNNGQRIIGIQAVSVCTPSPVPAPGAAALTGLGGLLASRRRRVHA